jgi:DNA-binding NarL/FixJ family response regulator
MKHTIAIVDDHILIAKALTGIVEKFSNFEVLYECENGKELQDRFNIKTNIVDIVLLDINMPIMDGFETAKWLKTNYPTVLILALSMQDDEQTLLKMIKAGANGYLLKNVHPAELENALQSLLQNGTYFPNWATQKILGSIKNDKKNSGSLIHFSEKEKEFFKYVCSEMSYKEIGEKMCCSPRTVESYRDTLFEKLHLKSRVGLAVYAMQNNLANE